MREIVILKSAAKSMGSYDHKTRNRIFEAIEKIPRGDVKKLNGKKLDNIYRLRIGKYRVVYQANEENITIVKVDTRGDVYK